MKQEKTRQETRPEEEQVFEVPAGAVVEVALARIRFLAEADVESISFGGGDGWRRVPVEVGDPEMEGACDWIAEEGEIPILKDAGVTRRRLLFNLAGDRIDIVGNPRGNGEEEDFHNGVRRREGSSLFSSIRRGLVRALMGDGA